jgi:hypothetical protein
VEEVIPNQDSSSLEKPPEERKKEPGLYFPVRRGSCLIRTSDKPIWLREDRTLRMWSSADRQTTARLGKTSGKVVIYISDEKSRKYARLEFSSLATLLCVLFGGEVESLSTEGSGSRIPTELARLGWLGAVSWLRSILPMFFETLDSHPPSARTSSVSDDS